MTLKDLEQYVLQQIQKSPKLSKLDDTELVNFAVAGLNEEAGEVSGLVCRAYYKGSDVALSKWQEELGDALWYLVAATRARGLTLQDLYDYNVKKLEERYGSEREKEQE